MERRLDDYKKLNQDMLNETVEFGQLSNPLADRNAIPSQAIGNYTQNIPRPKYDKDVIEIVEVVRFLNNMAPIRMPVYNFNLDEINGERYYRPDGTLLLIREYDSDVIRDYYASSDNKTVLTIREQDKMSGRLRVKVEPITRAGSRLKTNITIFDEKINHKYTIMQLAEDGIVSNITEFSGEGKSFRTLFRNIDTSKPARYLEGKDSKESGFEMIDCIFDNNGGLARIRKYSNKKEVNIDYTDKNKSISVKTKE